MKKGTPESSLPIIIASLSDSTYNQYEKPLREWWEYCKDENVPVFDAPIPAVLKFLTTVSNKVNSHGTVNTYRSAVSLISIQDLGNNPIIKRFCRGSSILKPQKAKYNDIWDPEPVLEFLSKQSPNADLSLKLLSEKLTTLLALTTAQRIQTLTKIKLKNIKISDESIKIYIPDRLKTSRIGAEQPLLHFRFFREQPRLCVASLLQTYIEKTTSLRAKDEDTLLLTYKAPHRPANSQSISRWIKQTLKNSGVDIGTFSGYSTRHAATSAAFRKGVNLDVIRQNAGWSKQSSVFIKFYNRPLRESNCQFASVILNSNN